MLGNSFDCLELFHGLSSRQLELVHSLFEQRYEPAGVVIFEQGDLAEYLYIIGEGSVKVRYKPDDGPELTVACVRPGGVVGWSAALGSLTYTSSAICFEDCQMLRVSSQELRKLCVQHPETGKLVLESLAAVIAERLRNTHHHVIAMLQQGLRVNINGSITASRFGG